MIPRIFHQVWLGDAPLHPLMVQWAQRWRDLHPTWAYKLWRGDGPTTIVCGTECVETRWPDLLQRACHRSQQSNIWRYELIAQQGGVYLDTDMAPLASIDSVIENRDAFVTSQWHDAICNACFGARPGHPWMASAVEHLVDCDPAISLSMGAKFAHEMYLRHQAEVHRFPREVFLFYPHRDFAVSDRLVVPETLAVHRWSCFWHPTGYAPLSSR